MNKSDLIDALSERLEGDKKAANKLIDEFVDLVQRTVQKGQKVSIAGFGVFEKRPRAARTARNPATGQSIKVKKTNVPAFRPGTQFKGIVSGTVKLPKAAPAKAAPAKSTAAKSTGTTARKAAPAAKKTAAPAKSTAKSTATKAATRSTTKATPTAKSTAAAAKKTTTAVKKTTTTAAKKTTAAAKKTAAPAKKTAAKKAPAKKAAR